MDLDTFNQLLRGFCNDPSNEHWTIISDFLKESEELELVQCWDGKGDKNWKTLNTSIWNKGVSFLHFSETGDDKYNQPQYELFTRILRKVLQFDGIEWTYDDDKNVRWKSVEKITYLTICQISHLTVIIDYLTGKKKDYKFQAT